MPIWKLNFGSPILQRLLVPIRLQELPFHATLSFFLHLDSLPRVSVSEWRQRIEGLGSGSLGGDDPMYRGYAGYGRQQQLNFPKADQRYPGVDLLQRKYRIRRITWCPG